MGATVEPIWANGRNLRSASDGTSPGPKNRQNDILKLIVFLTTGRTTCLILASESDHLSVIHTDADQL